MNSLFTPSQLGQINIHNRLVMAPMTRSRANADGSPGELTAQYYSQRAAAGLIITEGVFPTAEGKGYVRTPGIETEAQINGWKAIATAVHDAGGPMVMQLMHTGRISHPLLQPRGRTPVAPSAIAAHGKAWTDEGQKDFVTPRALSAAEIKETIQAYRNATRNALAAGFDGVELHGATGYLPEQFLSSNTNRRTDEYGGSLENRARFILEALSEMIAEAGAGRVGLKISPEMNLHDIADADPEETYGYLVDHLPKNMAYLHVALFGTKKDYHSLLRPRFGGTYIAGGGLTKDTAEALLKAGKADAVAFGSAFLANPDLPERLERNAPLNEPDQATFYTPGSKGYTDYLTLAELAKSAR